MTSVLFSFQSRITKLYVWHSDFNNSAALFKPEKMIEVGVIISGTLGNLFMPYGNNKLCIRAVYLSIFHYVLTSMEDTDRLS